jgi:hypothetical protein
VIEIVEPISLKPISDDRKQQMPRQMSRGWSTKDTLPSGSKPFEIETAQMRDLDFQRRFGRGATIATALLHRFRPSALLGLQPLTKRYPP